MREIDDSGTFYKSGVCKTKVEKHRAASALADALRKNTVLPEDEILRRAAGEDAHSTAIRGSTQLRAGHLPECPIFYYAEIQSVEQLTDAERFKAATAPGIGEMSNSDIDIATRSLFGMIIDIFRH